MEKSARAYTITEETLDKVKAELMEQFKKYSMIGKKAKDEKEMRISRIGLKEAALGASIFVELAPDDYPVDELLIIIIAQLLS